MASQYNSFYEVENTDSSCPDGYHPVSIGDVLQQRYRIVHELGYGGYSTVWLAYDDEAHRFVSLKIPIADPPVDCHAREAKALHDLAHATTPAQDAHPGRRCFLPVLDTFKVEGPNCTHACYTMEPTRDSVDQAKENRLFPLPVVRALAGALVQAVAYIHSSGYVHGGKIRCGPWCVKQADTLDIYLENVFVRPPPHILATLSAKPSVEQFHKTYGPRHDEQPLASADDGGVHVPPVAVVPAQPWLPRADKFTLADVSIAVIDFGEAFQPGTEVRCGSTSNTPLPMRPPEARFMPDAPMSFPTDIWTLAIALWNLVGMKKLAGDDFASDDDVVSQYIDVLGPLPDKWRESANWREHQALYFDEQGRRRDPDDILWPSVEVAFDEGVQKYRQMDNVGVFEENERAAFIDLIRCMAVFDPAGRITIDGVLKHKWMQEWALPAFNEANKEVV